MVSFSLFFSKLRHNSFSERSLVHLIKLCMMAVFKTCRFPGPYTKGLGIDTVNGMTIRLPKEEKQSVETIKYIYSESKKALNKIYPKLKYEKISIFVYHD